MSNIVSINAGHSLMTFVRVGKTGKEAIRGLMGVMSSGNKTERESATIRLVCAYWGNHTYGPLVGELCRVFNAKADIAGAAFIGLDFKAPKKAALLSWLRGVVASRPEGAKGERAVYLKAITSILAYEDCADEREHTIVGELAAPELCGPVQQA